jgi:hypothetical protein
MARLTQVAMTILREIFAREELPLAPPRPPDRRRVNVLSLLFAPEPLPEEPPGPSRPRGRWLAWLFAPERLDR